tara:strand:- start:622 stop:801 length:180 start_codon:yes stop_codon:yes gene_type:complete
MSDEFVSAMQQGNNIEAENAFKNAMQNKIGDALEMKRKEIANNFVKTKVTKEKEDAEEV